MNRSRARSLKPFHLCRLLLHLTAADFFDNDWRGRRRSIAAASPWQLIQPVSRSQYRGITADAFGATVPPR